MKYHTKIAIYSRKSKFTGKGESIDNQIELCRQYIKIHLPNINENDIEIFEDEGFSGGNTNRPEFKRMMKLVKDKQFSSIICYRLDRISRNISDFAKLIEELENFKTSFISIKEQFDTSSPMGRAMMYISSVFSQLERETIAERIRDNMQELAKTGRWLGGITPTGYKSEPLEKITIDGKVRKAFKLTVVNKEAEIVKLIFNKFSETHSLTKTQSFLLQENCLSKNNKNFTRITIKNILQNPVYLIADRDSFIYFKNQNIELFSDEKDFDNIHGIMAYNKTLQKHGKSNEIRNISDWIIAVGKHRGLISGKKWIDAQNYLIYNKSKSYQQPHNNYSLLSGLLYCKSCGGFMRTKMSQRKNEKGEFIYSYLCKTKEHSKMLLCSINNPNGNILDELVCNEIKKLDEDYPKFIKELLKILKINWSSNNNELLKLTKQLSETENEIENLTKSLSSASNTPAMQYIINQINILDEKHQRLITKISENNNILENQKLSDSEYNTLKKNLSFKNAFDNMNTEQKRTVLHTFIKKITWNGEYAEIYLLGTNNVPEPPCMYSK